MKKLLIALLALGTLSIVPTAEAGRRGCGKEKTCHAPKACEKPCAPKCNTVVEERIVYEPCTKMIEVEGQCPHTICKKVTTCETESKRCTGPCEVSCPSAVNSANRGGGE